MPRTPTFQHHIIFPIIARLIQEHSLSNPSAWMTRDKIVDAMLNDEDGYREVLASLQVDKLQNHLEETQTLEKKAGNMIDWFSQKITEGGSQYQDKFCRRRNEEKWEYKPKQV